MDNIHLLADWELPQPPELVDPPAEDPPSNNCLLNRTDPSLSAAILALELGLPVAMASTLLDILRSLDLEEHEAALNEAPPDGGCRGCMLPELILGELEPTYL